MDLYCPVCGAANAPEHSTCFACKQPLALQADKKEPARLLHHRYQVLKQVGTGGFGAVYKALDTRERQHPVAIKQINLRGLTAQEMIEATDGFNREVQMLSALSHPHLPRIHAHFTDPDHWYLVMDFIEGETLEQYLHTTSAADKYAIRALPLDEVLDIALQLCGVLTYLHTRQPAIIFRDLKPANLMRTPDGQLYLIDFGIARFFKPGQTRDTIPFGSPGYAAPEQYGRTQTTPRSDVYSLGALLHHLLSRHDPSEAPFTFAPLPGNGHTGQRELATLVTRMVELDATRRPSDMSEIRTALLSIRELRVNEPRVWRPAPGQIPPAFVPVSAKELAAQQQQRVAKAAKKKRSRRAFLAGGLVMASSLTMGGFSYWHYWHPSRLSLETGSPVQLPTPDSEVSTIAWSPDGKMVAFGLSDGGIVGTSFSQQPFLTASAPFRLPVNPAAQPISILAWSPDHLRLAAVSQTGQTQIWQIGLQQELSIPAGTGEIRVVAWSPDSQYIAFVNAQGGLSIHNARNGTNLSSNTAFSGKNALAWSPDGTRLVTVYNGSVSTLDTLEIWEIQTNRSLASITINAPAVTALAWSPDGQYIAALSVDGTLQVWDSGNTKNPLFSQLIASQQNQLAWSPDSRFLTTLDDAGNLLLLNRSSGQTLMSVPITDPSGRGSIFPGRALTWLSDNQQIAVANNNLACWFWSLPWW